MTRQQKIGAGVAAGIIALLYFTGGDGGTPRAQQVADLTDYTCQSLAPQVIEMSKGREPEILELTDFEKVEHHSSVLTCRASAEWSQGEGRAEFGAHKSDGGSIILTYQQL